MCSSYSSGGKERYFLHGDLFSVVVEQIKLTPVFLLYFLY